MRIKILIITIIIAVTVLLSSLLYEDDFNIRGQYYKRFIADDIEIYKKDSNFVVGPRIFFFKVLDNHIYIIQRAPIIKNQEGGSAVEFGECNYYFIDMDREIERGDKDLTNLRALMRDREFLDIEAAAREIC